ncbi:MAG: response regulator [Candidatus Omnitrophota bacterium]|nr:response regulator [Candidatus Omnitrophota bacterium]
MGKTILIVEDEQNLVELLKFRLETNGYHVEVAFDGEDGLSKISTVKPDLVILDIMMPKIDGYEVLRRVKADPKTKNIPIIVLTARTQNKDIDQAKTLNADSFIAKPFEPSQLLGEIERLLGDR